MRIIGISGLRGVGKTVGLLQCLKDLNVFNDSVYIELNTRCSDESFTAQDFVDFIQQNFSNKKYIFIDEITSIRDFTVSAMKYYNVISRVDCRIVICGTNSLALTILKEDSLYHRISLIDTTFISYSDAERTTNQSFKDYVINGGLYRDDSISNIDDVKTYIQTSVVENIFNTVIKNSVLGSAKVFEDLCKQVNGYAKLRSIIFTVLLNVAYHTVKRSKFNINFITSNYEDKANDVIEYITDIFNIDKDYVFKESESKEVLDLLVKIGLLVSIDNVASNYDYYTLYYITNVSIYNQLLNLILRAIDAEYKYNEGRLYDIHNKLGYVLESVIICHTVDVAKKYNYAVCFYHDKRHREIDMIIKKQNNCKDILDLHEGYSFFEIKFSEDREAVKNRLKWLADEELLLQENAKVVKRAAIYMGEEEDIEQDGILYISALNYVKNVKKYICMFKDLN